MSKNSSKRVTQHFEKTPIKPRRKSIKAQIKDLEAKALIKAIIKNAKKPDAETTAQGLELRRLKDLAARNGLMGDKTWFEWAMAVFNGQIDLSLLRLLNDIALAPDKEQRKLLLDHRTNGAKRARRFREREKQKAKQAKRLAIERQWIIRWAKSAPHAEVKRAWRHIHDTFDA